MSDSDAAVNVLNITLAVSHIATALCYVALLATTPLRLPAAVARAALLVDEPELDRLLLITLNALFSLLSRAFVYETYLPQDVAPPIWLVAAEVAMQPIFVFNYVLMLAVAQYWLGYVFSASRSSTSSR